MIRHISDPVDFQKTERQSTANPHCDLMDDIHIESTEHNRFAAKIQDNLLTMNNSLFRMNVFSINNYEEIR